MRASFFVCVSHVRRFLSGHLHINVTTSPLCISTVRSKSNLHLVGPFVKLMNPSLPFNKLRLVFRVRINPVLFLQKANCIAICPLRIQNSSEILCWTFKFCIPQITPPSHQWREHSSSLCRHPGWNPQMISSNEEDRLQMLYANPVYLHKWPCFPYP